MTFGEKLCSLRRARGLSQEQLAEQLDVSRQSVSKWEADASMPEIARLVAIADFFGTSVDDLVRSGGQARGAAQDTAAMMAELGQIRRAIHGRDTYEYKSKARFLGIPLVHVKFSRNGVSVARGVIAIGNIAMGFFSLGGLALGLLLALGGVAVGGLSLGGVSIGLIAFGGCAIGMYAAGGVAVASELALGGAASGKVAIGGATHGVHTLHVVEETTAEQVRTFILRYCPSAPNWLARWLSFFR
nr:helix-turn-helix transcriptional regulator [Maliibacterium massiliense]